MTAAALRYTDDPLAVRCVVAAADRPFVGLWQRFDFVNLQNGHIHRVGDAAALERAAGCWPIAALLAHRVLDVVAGQARFAALLGHPVLCLVAATADLGQVGAPPGDAGDRLNAGEPRRRGPLAERASSVAGRRLRGVGRRAHPSNNDVANQPRAAAATQADTLTATLSAPTVHSRRSSSRSVS